MRVLGQPVTARLDLHSPSLGNPVMLLDDTREPALVEWQPRPVPTPPPDPAHTALLDALAALHNEVADLRADLASRTLLARLGRLWHRLSSWRIQ